MWIGVIFPQTEIGNDPGAIRAYAQAAEDLRYAHILAYDHILGADPARRPGWRGYTHEHAFHEPFVLFGYLAAVTTGVELVPGVIILPQRQTALVAKQAAEVDVLSGGRLRLGVGIGWNPVEYEALGVEFRARGRLIEEQMEVLRLLWTREVVSYEGEWHKITEAGINPLPMRRPIPLWLGGSADALLRRVARMGDGWFPQRKPDEQARDMMERLRGYVREAGRSPGSVGIEARVTLADGSPDDWARWTEGWRELGATHVGVNTMGAGLRSVDEHIEAIRRYKEVAAAIAR
jgi:probable F420-dependent oxidoreductase